MRTPEDQGLKIAFMLHHIQQFRVNPQVWKPCELTLEAVMKRLVQYLFVCTECSEEHLNDGKVTAVYLAMVWLSVETLQWLD